MGGVVLESINSLIYDNYEYIFNDFVTKFDNIKKEGGYYKIFGKLMINSLYGGMALNNKNEIDYVTFSEDEANFLIQKMDINTFYKLNDVYILNIQLNYKSKIFFKNKKNSNLSERNVSYSAAISAKSRIKLYRAMIETIADNGRLLYCDTDSIFAAYDKNDNRTKSKNFE
jgi:hypothetical protein